MSSKKLTIKQLRRSPRTSQTDELDFIDGVNAIVGEKDAGKTKWLGMLDYLMGNDAAPEDALGSDLANKYDSVAAELNINGETVTLERKWKLDGMKYKVLVNGEAIDVSDFSRFLLQKLEIPAIRFPKGDPFAERTWPHLSWRMLYRHIYRQERFWGDLADKQPDVEQHACLMQFLGLAQKLFPEQYGSLVSKKKELLLLQTTKGEFQKMFDELSRDLVQQSELSVSITDGSISSAVGRIDRQIQEISDKRNSELQVLREAVGQASEGSESEYHKSNERWSTINNDIAQLKKTQVKTSARRNELAEYKSSIQAEFGRLQRLKSAGTIFADLKVTHCPVCDQPPRQFDANPNSCYLCGQLYLSGTVATGDKRIEFELDRLSEELTETEDLLRNIEKEASQIGRSISELTSEMSDISGALDAARRSAIAFLPPDLTLFDRQVGRLEEQKHQLESFRKAYLRRKDLSAKIGDLEMQIKELQAETDRLSADVSFTHFEDFLADKINTYLNELNAGNPTRWQHGRIEVKIKSHSFDLTLNGLKCSSQIGYTSHALLLLAYHYALLSLSGHEGFNYPGFLVIDFPLELLDSKTIGDSENYLLEPFVRLCQEDDMQHTQVIVAGRAFDKLDGANRIPLADVWNTTERGQ